MTPIVEYLSTTDMASAYGVDEWRVRRLYEEGDLPEPPRFAGRRAISICDVGIVADALKARGWLPEEPKPQPVGGDGGKVLP